MTHGQQTTVQSATLEPGRASSDHAERFQCISEINFYPFTNDWIEFLIVPKFCACQLYCNGNNDWTEPQCNIYSTLFYISSKIITCELILMKIVFSCLENQIIPCANFLANQFVICWMFANGISIELKLQLESFVKWESGSGSAPIGVKSQPKWYGNLN